MSDCGFWRTSPAESILGLGVDRWWLDEHPDVSELKGSGSRSLDLIWCSSNSQEQGCSDLPLLCWSSFLHPGFVHLASHCCQKRHDVEGLVLPLVGDGSEPTTICAARDWGTSSRMGVGHAEICIKLFNTNGELSSWFETSMSVIYLIHAA